MDKHKGDAVNEYGRLKEVLMCPPERMKIKQPLNNTQEQYKKENIDKNKAVKQHQNLQNVLKENGVRVHLLTPEEGLPEQVFTRDLGFASDQGLIIGQMNMSLREPETAYVKQWFDHNQWEYQEMTSGALEGGDVLIDGDLLFAGNSSRTTKTAIEELTALFPDKKVISMPLERKYLHLDCVFNIISPGTALLFPPALPVKTVREIGMHYRTITINEWEQFQLAANVLSIGSNTIISMPQNNSVNERMRAWGFHVIEVELSEIIKSGGAFRCVTFPLVKSK
ncbi:dimethylarginine dimethylaminohydrolase family protein [Salibacterium aidingense]|uniref:dimethylarginine dimethylaminohydrolase family protein n=1 Tax=Salibacterium aidingense TaxID=384933 RepID=UPI003BDC271A